MTTTAQDSQNFVPVTPDLNAWIRLMLQSFSANLNCVSLATVNSFNATNQTVNLTINYIRVFRNANPDLPNPSPDGQTSNVFLPYPVLVQCPVFIIQGGGGFLTFPIQVGDTGLVIFNDRELSTWLKTGQITYPQNQRTHDLSDGIYFGGIRSMVNAIANYFSGIKLSYANGYLTIDSSGNIVINSPAQILVKGDNGGGSLEIDSSGNLLAIGNTITIKNAGGQGVISIDASGNISIQGISLQLIGVPVSKTIGSLYGPTATDGFVNASAQAPTNTGSCSMIPQIGPTNALGIFPPSFVSNSNNTAFPSAYTGFFVPKGWYYQIIVVDMSSNQIMNFTPFGT